MSTENHWELVQLSTGKVVRRDDVKPVTEPRWVCPDPGHSGGGRVVRCPLSDRRVVEMVPLDPPHYWRSVYVSVGEHSGSTEQVAIPADDVSVSIIGVVDVRDSWEPLSRRLERRRRECACRWPLDDTSARGEPEERRVERGTRVVELDIQRFVRDGRGGRPEPG